MRSIKKYSILGQIRWMSLRHMIVPVMMLLIALVVMQRADFDNVFSPVIYTNSFDAYSAYNKGKDNVVVSINELKYTGYNIMKGDKIVAAYYYDLNGERCMFYKLDCTYESMEDVPKVLRNQSISAKFVTPDGITQNMMESFATSINWTYEGLSSITFPVFLDEREYNVMIYYILYIFLIAVTFYSVYVIAGNIILFITPYLHPAYMRIKIYYPDMTYFEMIDYINENYRDNVLIKAGRMYLTDEFFINIGPKEVSILPLSQVVLGYEYGQLFALFGIHIKMNHTLHLRGFKNVRIHASNKKATHVTIVMDYLRENYPDIIWGHTPDNIKAYKQIIAAQKISEKSTEEMPKEEISKEETDKQEK